MRPSSVAPVVARHQQHEPADIGRVVLGGFVEKPFDEPRIDLVERQPLGDRLGEKAAQPLRLDLRDPARRLAVLEARGRAEQHQAAAPARPDSSPAAGRDSRRPNCRRYGHRRGPDGPSARSRPAPSARGSAACRQAGPASRHGRANPSARRDNAGRAAGPTRNSAARCPSPRAAASRVGAFFHGSVKSSIDRRAASPSLAVKLSMPFSPFCPERADHLRRAPARQRSATWRRLQRSSGRKPVRSEGSAGSSFIALPAKAGTASRP